MRNPTTPEARTRVRAYFLTLNTGADHLAAWLAAERTEIDLAAKRSAAARKGAATRAAARSTIAPARTTPRRAASHPAGLH